MRQTIGIYCGNDWTGARAYADALRADGRGVVRVRNGAAFTPDQVEPFDAVFVRGDFPAVMTAYPDAKLIAEEGNSPAPPAPPGDDSALTAPPAAVVDEPGATAEAAAAPDEAAEATASTTEATAEAAPATQRRGKK